MQDEYLSVSWWLMAEGPECKGSAKPLVTAKLSCYKKVNMNHTGSLTLAWPQCRAENGRGRGRQRERIKHI